MVELLRRIADRAALRAAAERNTGKVRGVDVVPRHVEEEGLGVGLRFGDEAERGVNVSVREGGKVRAVGTSQLSKYTQAIPAFD